MLILFVLSPRYLPDNCNKYCLKFQNFPKIIISTEISQGSQVYVDVKMNEKEFISDEML